MRCLIIALLVAACDDDAASELERGVAEKQRAYKVREDAIKAADEAEEIVAKLEREAAQVTEKVDAALAAVAEAQTQTDRDSAKAKLAVLQREQAEYRRRIAEAKRAPHRKGSKISKECMDNPLAKGCR